MVLGRGHARTPRDEDRYRSDHSLPADIAAAVNRHASRLAPGARAVHGAAGGGRFAADPGPVSSCITSFQLTSDILFFIILPTLIFESATT
jgi:hypothetical protein